MISTTRRGATALGAVLAMILAVVFSTFGGAAHAAGSSKSEKKAIQSFAAGRYDEALEIYANLYADTLNPVYLRNIGRCQQKLKQPDKAIESFRDYLQKGKNISADERAEINGYIKEMEALRDEQARQQQPLPTPAPPGPAAPVQPIPAQPEGTPPPGYTAAPPAVYPTGPGPAQQPAGALVAQPGPAPAESQPIYTKWWFWTIVGAVVVGGVVTAVALSSGGTSRPPCPMGTTCQGP
jgi:hypothetical protein